MGSHEQDEERQRPGHGFGIGRLDVVPGERRDLAAKILAVSYHCKRRREELGEKGDELGNRAFDERRQCFLTMFFAVRSPADVK